MGEAGDDQKMREIKNGNKENKQKSLMMLHICHHTR